MAQIMQNWESLCCELGSLQDQCQHTCLPLEELQAKVAREVG